MATYEKYCELLEDNGLTKRGATHSTKVSYAFIIIAAGKFIINPQDGNDNLIRFNLKYKLKKRILIHARNEFLKTCRKQHFASLLKFLNEKINDCFEETMDKN